MGVKICIDAGHYGKYNRSPVVKAYYESDMAWKLHNYLKVELETYGVTVITTRPTQDEDLGLTSRGKKAKGCDLFLSIHSNACNTESVDKPVACCSVSGKADTIGQRLADTVASVMNTKQPGDIWKRKGTNGDYYGVLRGAASVGVPGVLLEHSFHTNTAATTWLLNDSNLKKLAKAEAKILAEYYGLKAGSQTTSETTSSAVLYRVQTGAFSEKSYASGLSIRLKEAGFDSYIVKVDGMYKVQVGAYEDKKNAESMATKLKNLKFDAYITTRSGEPVLNTKKSLEVIANEVIAGKWGNGEDRKKRLIDAGYDYAAVQKLVNQMI